MKSKTLIEKQLKKKRNSVLVETVIACKKNEAWRGVAALLSGSSRTRRPTNLDKINNADSKIVVIAGKVLSVGNLDKKIKIVALNASESAIVKINKAGSEFSTILDEIKSNPEFKDAKILK